MLWLPETSAYLGKLKAFSLPFFSDISFGTVFAQFFYTNRRRQRNETYEKAYLQAKRDRHEETF